MPAAAACRRGRAQIGWACWRQLAMASVWDDRARRAVTAAWPVIRKNKEEEVCCAMGADNRAGTYIYLLCATCRRIVANRSASGDGRDQARPFNFPSWVVLCGLPDEE